MRLTQKQESFCLNILSGMSQREAYFEAGYSKNMSIAVIDVKASQVASNGKVAVRIAELRKLAESEKVADYQERQEILSEIARGDLLDYQEVGADGGYLNIGKESPNTRAISEITSRTEYGKNGANAALITKVKLHSPTQAIDLLNKMDKVYDDSPSINVDNRTLNIYVNSDKAKELTEKIIEGERTDGHNGNPNL